MISVISFKLCQFYLFKETLAWFKIRLVDDGARKADSETESERGRRIRCDEWRCTAVERQTWPRAGTASEWWSDENLASAGNWDIRAFAV